MVPNVDILQIQYEIFNLSPEALAMEYKLPTDEVRNLVKEMNWKRNPLLAQCDSLHEESLKESKDLVAVTEDYVQKLKDKLDLVALLKQEVLSPTYTKLEALLVYKAISILEKLDESLPTASNSLKILTGVLQELLQNNTNLTSAKQAVDSSDNKVVVQIMNQVSAEKELKA